MIFRPKTENLSISQYAAISLDKIVVVFGGLDGHKDVDNVAKFEDKKW